MTLTRLSYSKEASRQANLPTDAGLSNEAGQILHLKRLLVTLKQHYEESLQAAQIQLQTEKNQRIELQAEIAEHQAEAHEEEKRHQEELQALRSQQASLKELLKKTQDELKTRKEEVSLETVVSTTSSHHLKQELEAIKKNLAQETKALESRYVQILNEKIELEHQCKQLHVQLEHQSSNLSAFQGQFHVMEDQNVKLEEVLRLKETALSESLLLAQAMQIKIQELEIRAKEKDFVQDKYEQLKDEWNELGERLEEAAEIRTQAETQLSVLQAHALKQEAQLTEMSQQLQYLEEEGKNLVNERDQLKILLDESETRLKVAQQHLAKKVKEAALLAERVDEQQNSLAEMTQTLDQQKTQIVQLQASVDLYQRQEKRLQEQLHDALKGTESQVAKWEEKYFRMYDKWQESEIKIRELKKFEEKHQQMQHLFANLGNFMGGSFNTSSFNNPPSTGYQTGHEIIERSVYPQTFDPPPADYSSHPGPRQEAEDEQYDLFGMRKPQDKQKSNPFS